MLQQQGKYNPVKDLLGQLSVWSLSMYAGLPFSRGYADFRENEVSESGEKK